MFAAHARVGPLAIGTSRQQGDGALSLAEEPQTTTVAGVGSATEAEAQASQTGR